MVMDYQCLFDRDVSWWDQSGRERNNAPHDGRNQPKDCHYSEIPSEAAFYAGYTTRAPPRLIRLMRFSHIKSQIETQDDILPSEDVVRGLEAPELSGIPGLRFLISPPRVHPTDAHGRLRQFNPEAPLPFDSKTFGYVVTVLRFHKACLSSLPRMMPEFGQISKITGPDGIISFYVETYSYRNRWHKLSVSYVPKTMTTSIFLHNMSVDDTRSLISRILRPTIQPLTIHPMLIPVLAFEFTWGFCQKELNRLFEHCISTYQALGLNNSRAFSHFRANEADDQAAAELSFGDGQDLCALEERVEFSIMMAKKLLSYFEDLEHKTPDGPLKSPFVEAGSIIQTRLEYLLDTLEFQLPRLRRAKGHTILNRTGLENRTAAQSNKIQYQIALESRADSSAMKAIAVLTMLFLPGTFVSTFFAMPLFDWQAERQSEVVNSRFWIYWAVTVPGTLAVLVLWRLWWTFEEWRVRKEEEGSGVWRDIVGWVRNRGHVEMGEDSREKGHGKESVGML